MPGGDGSGGVDGGVGGGSDNGSIDDGEVSTMYS